MNLKPGFQKYIPFQPQPIQGRTWPDQTIQKSPIWRSVELRDGNQALDYPLHLKEKLDFFHTWAKIRVTGIEAGLPLDPVTHHEDLRYLIPGRPTDA